MAATPVQQTPETPAETMEQRFRRLAAAWREVGPTHPRNPVRYDLPVYQEIIGLGAAVVPLVLRELEQRPAHWFTALRALTGADPMDPADRGKVRKVAAAWLRWGRANGYQW